MPWLGWLAALVLVAASAFLRVEIARADPNFSRAPAEGLLKSDPGLAYYVVERIVDARGGIPDDFRADPRIEHPTRIDVPALMPVGLEFVVAWVHLALGRSSLLDTCLWVSSLCASLVLLGVFGLAHELTRRLGPALLALAAAATMFANYRTIGFVLVDEDLALPLFALHLWLAARAWRVETALSMLLAGLALAAALASWHAMSFVVTLEALVLLGFFARTRRHPFETVRGLVFLVVLVAACVLVPMLAATGALFSFPVLVALALAGASALARLGGGSGGLSRRAGLLAVAAVLLAGFLLGRAFDTGQANHAHVLELVLGKLTHLGRLPEDPRELSFDVRLMWQGPFATLDLGLGLAQLGWPLIALVLLLPRVARALLRPEADPRAALVAIGALLSLPIAWLIMRTIVLPGLLLPVALAWLASGSGGRFGVALALVLLQAVQFTGQAQDVPLTWYRPPERQLEIANLVRALPALVPEDEAVAADFMTSTAILARTRRPILFQPKWESAPSRARVEDLLVTLYERSPDEFRRMLLERYDCRYLVVDRYTLWTLSRYAAGLPLSAREPAAGSAARVLLSGDERALHDIPGYRLLYRSPPDLLHSQSGQPSDFYRLFELVP